MRLVGVLLGAVVLLTGCRANAPTIDSATRTACTYADAADGTTVRIAASLLRREQPELETLYGLRAVADGAAQWALGSKVRGIEGHALVAQRSLVQGDVAGGLEALHRLRALCDETREAYAND